MQKNAFFVLHWAYREAECIKGMKDKGIGVPILAAGLNEHCQGHPIAKMHLEIQEQYTFQYKCKYIYKYKYI